MKYFANIVEVLILANLCIFGKGKFFNYLIHNYAFRKNYIVPNFCSDNVCMQGDNDPEVFEAEDEEFEGVEEIEDFDDENGQ